MNKDINCVLVVTQYLDTELEIDGHMYHLTLTHTERGPAFPYTDIADDPTHSWRAAFYPFPYRWEMKGHRPHHIECAGANKEQAIERMREVLLHYISKYGK